MNTAAVYAALVTAAEYAVVALGGARDSAKAAEAAAEAGVVFEDFEGKGEVCASATAGAGAGERGGGGEGECGVYG